jgi:cell division protein DivIC
MRPLQVFKSLFEKMPAYTKNFYVLVGMVFVFWMLFFDVNDVFTQWKTFRKLKDVENEKKLYSQKIIEVKKQKDELFGDKDAIEKYARETYLMKRPKEEIYLVEIKD